jgi:glycosyltransferase involved in cell wall biosynthesis
LISDSGCGLCVNPEDTTEISNAIQELLAEPVRINDMGERGKQLIKDQYNWETQESLLLSVYDRLQRK